MKKIFATIFLYALPVVVFAQGSNSLGGGSYSTGAPGNLSPLKNLVISIGQLFNIMIPVLIAAALVVFFFGLVRYVWGGGKDSAQGRRIMFAGLLSLFVMVSVWGIIRLAQSALGVSSDATNQVTPYVNGLPR